MKFPRKRNLFEESFRNSWWIFLFFLVCYAAYEQGLVHTRRQHDLLATQLQELVSARDRALREQEELRFLLAGADDPAWIEQSLMQHLGMVPEGYRKVYFAERKESL